MRADLSYIAKAIADKDELVELAKTQPCGCYIHESRAYRVKNNTLTHFTHLGAIIHRVSYRWGSMCYYEGDLDEALKLLSDIVD